MKVKHDMNPDRIGMWWECFCCKERGTWRYAYLRLDGLDPGQAYCPKCAEHAIHTKPTFTAIGPSIGPSFSEVEIGSCVIASKLGTQTDALLEFMWSDKERQEYHEAVDKLVGAVSAAYEVAEVLLKMDTAMGMSLNLKRAVIIQNLGEALERVKELRGKK